MKQGSRESQDSMQSGGADRLQRDVTRYSALLRSHVCMPYAEPLIPNVIMSGGKTFRASLDY